MADDDLELPVVDFGAFLLDEGIVVGDEPTAGQVAAAKALDAACREHGFVTLKNTGIPAATVKRAFAASEELFASDDKSKLARIRPETNRGYSPLATEGINSLRSKPDAKESFNVRANENDYSGTNPETFQPAAEALWAACSKVRGRHCLLCALALGLPRDYFSQHFVKDELTTLRFLHYPPCEDMGTRIGEHTDFGLFTLLFVAGGPSSRGLQLKPVLAEDDVRDTQDSDEWKYVAPSSSEDEVVCVVNTGALMARWTNDEWRATAHRVIVPDVAVAAKDRYSIAFFVDPDGDAIVEAHPKFTVGGIAKYPKTTSREYLMEKLRGMMSSPADAPK